MAEKSEMKFSLTLPGSFWLAGWLFALGYLHLPFWRALLAIVLWPYELGSHFK